MRNQHILSADEQARALNFKHPQKQLEFIATRTLVRHCLAKYLDTSAEMIEFATEPKGKPYVVNAPPNFYFNLSHSDHLVALAVSNKGVIGIDIEVDRSRSFMSIAKRYFHTSELAQLQTCGGTNQRELFFRFWTLKEAFFKALGGGIATGLSKIQFKLSPKIESSLHSKLGSAIDFTFAEELGLQKNEWQFYQVSPADAVYLAVANHSSEPLTLRWINGADVF